MWQLDATGQVRTSGIPGPHGNPQGSACKKENVTVQWQNWAFSGIGTENGLYFSFKSVMEGNGSLIIQTEQKWKAEQLAFKRGAITHWGTLYL